MEQIKSEFNGAIFDKPAGINRENWARVEKNLNDTEGGRLFRKHHAEIAPAASTGNTYGIPASDSIEFEADKAKRLKKEAQTENLAKARAAKVRVLAKDEKSAVVE